MITKPMTAREVEVSPTQVLYNNGSYLVEATYIAQDDTTAAMTFFIDDLTGKNISSCHDYNEAKRFADELANLDASLAA